MVKYLEENFHVMVNEAEEDEADDCCATVGRRNPSDKISTKASFLRERYRRLDRAERVRLSKENGSKYPEIKIEWVWQKILQKPITDDEMKKLCNTFRETSRDKLEVYESVPELFSRIRKDGGRIFLLSNAQRLFTEKELDDTGLTPLFDDIFISSDMGIMKPDGNYLQALIDKHHLKKEECVMIGNEPASDGGVAKAVGIDFILVSDGDFTRIR
jgi:putative hydrolase of the HAD superfamily